MKKVARVVTLLSVLVGLGGSLFAQPFLGEKESSEMKKRRNSNVKMRILHIQGAVEMGKITKVEGVYRIKAIKSQNAFKNANPEWKVFKRGSDKQGRKYARSSKGKKGNRGDRMNNSRKGNRGDRINNSRKGNRGDRMKSGKKGDSAKNRVTRKNETSALKSIRHQIENIRIKRIKDAAKKGYIGTKKADYLVKRIKYQSRFKDSNPEWTKYGRGQKGRRGHRSKGRKGGKRGQGCEDSR